MLKGHMPGNKEGSSAVGKILRGIWKLTWEEGFLRPIDSHKMDAKKEEIGLSLSNHLSSKW